MRSEREGRDGARKGGGSEREGMKEEKRGRMGVREARRARERDESISESRG